MHPFTLSPEDQTLVDTARSFARDYVRPNAAKWEAAKCIPREALAEAAKAGLTTLDARRGPDYSKGFLAKLLVLEALSEEDFSFAFSLTNTQGIAGRIVNSGTAAQKERYEADLLSTRSLGATALSEPGAGSDFAGISTQAKKVEGGWVLNGEKGWITNAAEASLFVTYAQTDSNLKWRGIASFFVDADREGFERVEPYELLSGHAIGVGGFRMNDYFVPDEEVIAGPGDAFKAAMNSVNEARVYVAGMVNAMVHASLAHAAEYGSDRQTFGKPLLGHQGIAWNLVDVANKLEASRLLTYRAAQMIEDDEDAMLAAAHAKKFAGDYGVPAIADCIQAMGARGMRSDVPLGRHLAGAKLACYTDGSTEIMNDRLAKSLAEDYRRGG